MITIIDYGMGNLGSIANMIKKVGGVSNFTSDPENVFASEKLILPGVGAFDQAMKSLNKSGMAEAIKQKVSKGTPLLGICLGMQLLAEHSEEGDADGLGLIPGNVVRFKFDRHKVPHMGWNTVEFRQHSPLTAEFEQWQESRFYFVHSYHFECNQDCHILGETNYGGMFTSAVTNKNISGTQFHPEKSHRFGMQLFNNFINSKEWPELA